MQLTKNELVNAPNMDIAQRLQTNDQHKKCSKIDCAKGPNHSPKQSPNDTTNLNPTMGNEHSQWWQK